MNSEPERQRHQLFDDVLSDMSRPDKPKVSRFQIGKVFERILLNKGPVPRIDIANGTMMLNSLRDMTLSPGTVQRAVEELVRAGLVSELEGVDRASSGRRILPLTPGGPKWAVMGVHVEHREGAVTAVRGVLQELDGSSLADEVKPVPAYAPTAACAAIADAVKELHASLMKSVDGSRRLLGIGVEVGGHVSRGAILDWGNANIPAPTSRLTVDVQARIPGVPVVVENDVNALTVQAYYQRRIDELHAVVVQVFDEAVGGALIVDGRLDRGKGGLAAEPGHQTVDFDVPKKTDEEAKRRMLFTDPCHCRHYGHVDTLAPPSRIRGELGLKNREELLAAAESNGFTRDEAGNLMGTRDADVFQRAGKGLGRGLATMVNITNPGQLILRLPQPLAQARPQSSGSFYLDAVRAALQEHAFSTAASDAKLHVEAVDQDAVPSQGASAAAVTVLNAFVEHAGGRDGCPVPATKHVGPQGPPSS